MCPSLAAIPQSKDGHTRRKAGYRLSDMGFGRRALTSGVDDASAPAGNQVSLPWTLSTADAGISASSNGQPTCTSANPCSESDGSNRKKEGKEAQL